MSLMAPPFPRQRWRRSRAPDDRKEIDARLAEIRENGLARVVERRVPVVNTFSVLVFDHSGSIVMTAIGPLASI